MKKFIDRFTYCVHRPRFFRQKAMLIVARGAMFRGIRKYLTKVFKAWGFAVTGYLGAGEPAMLRPQMRERAVHQIRAAAEKFHASLQRPAPRPRLGDVIWFHVWQITAQTTPVDRQYWREHGWLEADYYYPARIGLFGQAVGTRWASAPGSP